MSTILEVNNIRKHFPVRGGALQRVVGHVHAVDDVSFTIGQGETLALVGESGCGKSTVGRLILQLEQISSGSIALDGNRIDGMSASALRQRRRDIQMVFQDPFSSLSPRMRIRDIIAEPLINFGIETGSGVDDRVARLLDLVRLPRDAANRFPSEFSGGQRQRIGIARALASNPKLIVCDEAVSALDVSVKAQIVNLLSDLQSELGLSLLFISHDLAIVEQLAHRVAVMYLGKLIEISDVRELFSKPSHPYTQALLSAVPAVTPGGSSKRVLLEGELPSPISPPSGCHFHTRCPLAFKRCSAEVPLLRRRDAEGPLFACHLDEAPALYAPLS